MRSGAVLLVLLAGCATQAKFEAKMNGLIGKPEAVLVSMYGPPGSVYPLSDGSKVMQYTRGHQMVIPGAVTYQPVVTNTTGNLPLNRGMSQTTGTYNQTSTTQVARQGAPMQLDLWCTVNFTIDPVGAVKSWASNGNHCVSDG